MSTAETGKPVEDDDEVKGYEIGGDEFLLIEEDEIEAVQIEVLAHAEPRQFRRQSRRSSRSISTRPIISRRPTRFRRKLLPSSARRWRRKKMAGLARIVLYRRERPVVIEPLGKGMLLTTLRYDNTVRQPDTVFDDIKTVKIDDEMIDLAEPHHRQEEGEVRSVEIRGPLRGCAARTDPGEEGRQEAAEAEGRRRSRPTSSTCSMR